jgi:sugar lactone lactonase YvrE
MRRQLITALAGVLLVTGAGTAAAARPPQQINGHAPTIHPEGVAWDPARNAFLIGSARHGTVSVVRPNGEVSTLISDPRMASTLGIHVDAVRNRVLVAYADLGVSERTTNKGGVGIFDLTTGRAEHVIDLGVAPNDLTIDWSGNAYVTDPASDTLYRVDVNGHPSVVVKDPRLASPTIGANGIAWHPAGYLLVVRYDTGELLRVSLRDPSRIDEVKLEKPLVGADGIALRPDGALVVVTNSLGAPGENAVTVLRPEGVWSAAKVAKRVAWPMPGTTVALTPYGSYVVSGRLELLFGQGVTSDEFFLRRL